MPERTVRRRHVWRVIDPAGLVLAKVDAPSRRRAEAEAHHYGVQYAMDHPVLIEERRPDGKSYRLCCIVDMAREAAP